MINTLTTTATKQFNLLSIGQRGVGKTVFFAGSYAELRAAKQLNHSQHLWFDCQDTQMQENMAAILSYVAETGQYPPPTMKITQFCFSVKQQNQQDTTTSRLGWWDVPGEICSVDNPDFCRMVMQSSSCCVFIDAHAIVHKPAYKHSLAEIIQQVMPIATLVSLHKFQYAFAVILTKCDLLESNSLIHKQLQEFLRPLTSRLDSVKAKYQTFYSNIPISSSAGVPTLHPQGATAPLLWLVEESSKLQPLTLSRHKSKLPTELLVSSLKNLFSTAGKSQVKKFLGLYLFPTTRKYILLLTITSVGLLGVLGLLSADYELVFQRRQPKNLAALQNLTTLQQRGQFNQAVSLMEKIVRQDPKSLDLRLHLAYLYEVTGQVPEAETAYDQVLAQQQNNLKALLGKAGLRKAQGDTKTAKALLMQAEKVAPVDLKPQVQAVALRTLQTPNQLTSD